MYKKITFIFIIAVLGGALVATTGCAANRHTPTTPANMSGQPSLSITTRNASQASSDELAAPNAVASTNWSELADLSYEKRLHFYAGFPLVVSAVDKQISVLVAKRASLRTSKNKSSWDLAMKEMRSSRKNLKATGLTINAANKQNWDEKLQLVGLAWQRTQVAEQKVRGSVLN